VLGAFWYFWPQARSRVVESVRGAQMGR
jgi:hypothetical protein